MSRPRRSGRQPTRSPAWCGPNAAIATAEFGQGLDIVLQGLGRYLLTHYVISALICKAATEAGIDPDRVMFKRTVRITPRRAADLAAFPP